MTAHRRSGSPSALIACSPSPTPSSSVIASASPCSSPPRCSWRAPCRSSGRSADPPALTNRESAADRAAQALDAPHARRAVRYGFRLKRSDEAGVQVSRVQRSHPGRATRSEVARPWFTALRG